MSAPMKKRRTNQVEVVIHDGKRKVFVGPKNGLKTILKVLTEHDYKAVTSNDSIPWEDLAKERLAKFTKPGLALRGARVKEGLSQVQLAGKLGIPQYNLSKMENGSRPIGKKMAHKLASVLNIDYRIFL